MGIRQAFNHLFFSNKRKKTTEAPMIELATMASTINIESEFEFDDMSDDLNAIEQLQSKLNDLTTAELVSKSAYLLSSTDPVQVSYTKIKLAEKGYRVHTLLPSDDLSVNEKAHSIFIYALVPTDTNEPAIISSRGTDFSDIHSAVHNVDPEGPAYSAIKDTAKFLLADIAEKCAGHAKICLTGHSQGGSISQLIYTHMLEEKALQGESELAEAGETYLPKLSDLSLQVFQSAGVNDDVADRAHAAAKKVAQSGVHLSADYFVRSWDVVNLSGNKILVSKSVSSDVADVSVTRVTEKDHKNYLRFDRADYSLNAVAQTTKSIVKKPSIMTVMTELGKKLVSPLIRQTNHVMYEAHTKNGFLKPEMTVTEEDGDLGFLQVVQDYEKDAWHSFNEATSAVEQYSNATQEGRDALDGILNRDLAKIDPTGILAKSRKTLHGAVAGKSIDDLKTDAVYAIGGETVAKSTVAAAGVASALYSGGTGMLTAYYAVRGPASLSSAVCGVDGTVNAVQAGQRLASGARQLGLV